MDWGLPLPFFPTGEVITMNTLDTSARLVRELAGLLLAVAAVFPSTGAASSEARPGYVALGDSIDFGVGDSDRIGYVPPFGMFALGPAVEVHNFSAPGATVRDIALSQLSPALTEVRRHLGHGVVVSWGGGGNDLLDFIASPQAATCLQVPSCLARINALLDEKEHAIDLTLKTLRSFAGPNTRILVRTQFNPLLKTGCDARGPRDLANAALEGLPGSPLADGLNDRIRTVAGRHGATVVELFDAFALNPDALVAADCVHPNDAGYNLILDAFRWVYQ